MIQPLPPLPKEGNDLVTPFTKAGGRLPDGELHLNAGKVVAIELDLTAKRLKDLETIMRNCTRSVYDAVWWLVRAGSVEGVSTLLGPPRPVGYRGPRMDLGAGVRRADPRGSGRHRTDGRFV
jgi:hypothetical protein